MPNVEEKFDPYINILLDMTPEELAEEALNRQVSLVSNEAGHFSVDVMVQFIVTDGQTYHGNIRLPLRELPNLCESPRVTYIRLASVQSELLWQSVPETKADRLHQRTDDPGPIKGQGVIIGIIDSGIDFLHEAFRNGDQSRILRIWDMNLEPDQARGEKRPIMGHRRIRELEDLAEEWLLMGISDLIDLNRIRSMIDTVHGVEYTKDDIEHTIQEIQRHGNDRKYMPPPPPPTPPVAANTPRFVRHRDLVGHGTHVAGIAASNHPDFLGMAPEAELVVVVSDYTDTALYDGIEYIRQVAGDRPFVINYSMGGPYGPRDGSGVGAREINQKFSDDWKGQALITSAGNTANKRKHRRGVVELDASNNPQNPVELVWEVPTNDRVSNLMEIWYKGTDTFHVEVEWPEWPEGGVITGGSTGFFDPATQLPSILDRRVKIFHADTGATNLENRIQASYSPPNPYNGDKQLYIKISRGSVYLYGIALNVACGNMYWIDSGTHKIQRANLDGSNVENLITADLRFPKAIALDIAGGKMYWTDAGTRKIQRANLDGSGVEDLVSTGLSAPKGIALDPDGGKMYWTDSEEQKIQRANLDGSDVEDLVSTGLSAPKGIALDPDGGNKMYWTDAGTRKIQRANLDGSDVEDLVSAGLSAPKGIALDPAGGKMYWTDALNHSIQRANLDGSGVEDLVSMELSYPKGIALDTTNGEMYWTDSGTLKIQRASLDGSDLKDLATIPLKPIIPGPWRVRLDVQNINSKSEGDILFDAWLGGGNFGRPDVDEITPTRCSTQGWVDVKITGDGFERDATSVAVVTTHTSTIDLTALETVDMEAEDVRRQAMAVRVITSKRLIATLPPVPAVTDTVEYDLYVTSPGSDTMVRYRRITYEAPGASGSPPTISDVSELDCGVIEQKVINITGSNFVENQTKVVFGNSPFNQASIDDVIKENYPSTEVTFVSDSEIRARVPVGPTESMHIHVITPNGSATHSAPMNMTTSGDAPEIDTVTPDRGPAIGWSRVTLAGDHFTNDSKVFFGTREATILTQTSTSIEVIAPPAPEKWVEFRPWISSELTPDLDQLFSTPFTPPVRVYTQGGMAERLFEYYARFYKRDDALFDSNYYDQEIHHDSTRIYTDQDNWYTIGQKAAAKFTIAVAAYDASSGATDPRTLFSSLGPRRSASALSPDVLPFPDRLKPDIAAPGYSIASAHSSFVLPVDVDRDDLASDENGCRTPYFVKKPGTSMASPHVAGAIALLFSQKTLSYSEILKALKDSAEDPPSEISLGDDIWPKLWGYGKLNAEEFYKEGTGEGCFIATAGYGSALHPDVCFLRYIRDNVLRKTRSGKNFFDAYWDHYNKFSPLIVDLMENDSQVKDIVRWSIVTPLVNYLKLLMNRPAHIPENTAPALKKFLETMQRDMLRWLGEIKVPERFDDLDNSAIVDELIVLLNYILKEERIEYLLRLTEKASLPLKLQADEAQQLAWRLSNGGCTPAEIRLILYGETNEAIDDSNVSLR